MDLWERAASAARSTILFQSASKGRQHSGWSRVRTPAFLPHYRRMPAAVLSGLDRGMVSQY